jgi:hypothetical protein
MRATWLSSGQLILTAAITFAPTNPAAFAGVSPASHVVFSPWEARAAGVVPHAIVEAGSQTILCLEPARLNGAGKRDRNDYEIEDAHRIPLRRVASKPLEDNKLAPMSDSEIRDMDA